MARLTNLTVNNRPCQSRGGAQAGATDDDMDITAFQALDPHLRSVAYPNSFKPNIQKYDSRSGPNT
jgi:hypothetical protein